MVDKEKIKSELEKIRLSHGGVLRPNDVVEWAKDPTTELHKKFEWDTDKAAYSYLLWQARQLIRTIVTVVSKGEGITVVVPTYHSLPTYNEDEPESEDNVDDGNRGYYEIIEIMSDERRRTLLLDEAYRDMKIFQKKYKDLKELAPVLEAIGQIISA